MKWLSSGARWLVRRTMGPGHEPWLSFMLTLWALVLWLETKSLDRGIFVLFFAIMDVRDRVIWAERRRVREIRIRVDELDPKGVCPQCGA